MVFGSQLVGLPYGSSCSVYKFLLSILVPSGVYGRSNAQGIGTILNMVVILVYHLELMQRERRLRKVDARDMVWLATYHPVTDTDTRLCNKIKPTSYSNMNCGHI